MMTIVIGFIAFVAIYASAANGEWMSAILGIVITLFLIGMAAGERKDMKAYTNVRDYWADGGPNRDRRK